MHTSIINFNQIVESVQGEGLCEQRQLLPPSGAICRLEMALHSVGVEYRT